MTCTRCLVLILLSLSWVTLTVPLTNVPDSDRGRQVGAKHGETKSLTYASLRSMRPAPTRFVNDHPMVTEVKKFEIIAQEPITIQPIKIKYSILEDTRPDVTLLDNSPDIALDRTSNNGFPHHMSTQSDSQIDHIFIAYDLNQAINEKNHKLSHDKNEEDNTNAKNDKLSHDKNKEDDFNEENDILFPDKNEEDNFNEENYILFHDKNEEDNTNLNAMEGNVDKSKHHGDIFSCEPCNCTYTARRSVIANCSHRNIDEVPSQLPRNTITLKLAFNRLQTLNTSSFLQYSDLLNATLSMNVNLTKIVNASLGNRSSKVQRLNLSHCAIQTIDDASFVAMPKLTVLTLKNNKLKNLTKNVFKGLNKLKSLDISGNLICFIEKGTFNKVKSLKTLDLSRNTELGYSNKSFPPSLLAHLKLLEKLSIHGNSADFENNYPNKALQQLVRLKDLSVDGLGPFVEFGPEMKSLENLVYLKLCGKCNIKNITEGFFKNIPYLKSFSMDSCPHFANVHPKAYTNLTNLQSLSFSNMSCYFFDKAFNDLKGLRNSRLKSLSFNRLRLPRYQCKYLGEEQAKYLKNTTLEKLDLSDNSISFLGRNFLYELPKTVKKLILKKNKFTSGTQCINDFTMLEELTELDISMQNGYNNFDTCCSTLADVSERNCPDKQFSNVKEDNRISKDVGKHSVLKVCGSEKTNVKLQFDNISTLDEINGKDQDQQTVTSSGTCYVNIPPKLKILKASQYNMFGMQILTPKLNNNSLSVIDFSGSFMSWGSGELPRGIIEANFGDNYCTNISQYFFQPNNSHARLLLNNNFLGPDFAHDENGDIFAELTQTTYLDISTNLIYKLHLQMFKGLTNLRFLKIADNKLYKINTTFAHMKHLRHIDFSRNSISWIDADTRNDFDQAALSLTHGHTLEIDLTMNPLLCTCAGLELISWMATTNVRFVNQNLLTCETDGKISEAIGDFKSRKQQLQRLCISNALFIVGCGGAITVVMVIIVIGLLYRYRWKLRYFHNTAMAALFGFKPDVNSKSGFTFDAYFVYTMETRDFVLQTCLKELEMKRGHRLCVEDRDFLPGTYIISSIVSAIRNSTKTVPVMTPDFFSGLYSEYSFKMAVMEELYKQRSVLHLLIYKPIPNDEMSHDELNVMKRSSYTEFPPEIDANDNLRQKFWDELSQAIGHTSN